MRPAKIIEAPRTEAHTFVTTVRNTDLSQRATLEETICNLSALLGIETVHRRESRRGGLFYSAVIHSVPGRGVYQSASNTILALSRKLLKRSEICDDV